MTFWKNAFAACLLTGLTTSLLAQSRCPAARRTIKVDPCALAVQLSPIDKPDVKIVTQTLDHKKQFGFVQHGEIVLDVSRGDQIAWSCSSKQSGASSKATAGSSARTASPVSPSGSFQILSIQKVEDPKKPGGPGIATAPDFPFCAERHDAILAPQKPGSVLVSGPPVPAAAGQWYKYSFVANGRTIDPHLIVTDGGGKPHGQNPCPQGKHCQDNK